MPFTSKLIYYELWTWQEDNLSFLQDQLWKSSASSAVRFTQLIKENYVIHKYKCLSANPQHAVSMAVLQHLDIRTLKLCADVKYVLHWLKYKSKRKLVITWIAVTLLPKTTTTSHVSRVQERLFTETRITAIAHTTHFLRTLSPCSLKTWVAMVTWAMVKAPVARKMTERKSC